MLTATARPSRLLGWSIALLSTFSSSILSPVGKVAVGGGLDPAIVLAVRLFIATGLLAVTIAVTHRAQLRIDRRGLWICFGAGLVTGFGMLMYFRALTWMSSSIAAMIFSLYPLAVLVLLALRGEAFTRRNSVRLALGLLGVYLLIGAQGAVDWAGLLLIFGSIMGFALLTAVIQWFLQGYDAMTVTLYTVAGMALANGLGWLVQGTAWTEPGPQGWLAILLLALVVSYLGRLTYFIAIRELGGGQTALLMPLEIFLSVLWSVLFLREALTGWQWAGGALILLSTLLAVQRLRPVVATP
ncbi:MAG: DMT family transporter [Anaerolineales bacterium]